MDADNALYAQQQPQNSLSRPNAGNINALVGRLDNREVASAGIMPPMWRIGMALDHLRYMPWKEMGAGLASIGLGGYHLYNLFQPEEESMISPQKMQELRDQAAYREQMYRDPVGFDIAARRGIATVTPNQIPPEYLRWSQGDNWDSMGR